MGLIFSNSDLELSGESGFNSLDFPFGNNIYSRRRHMLALESLIIKLSYCIQNENAKEYGKR